MLLWLMNLGFAGGAEEVTVTRRGGGIAHYGRRDEWQLRRALKERAALEAAFEEKREEVQADEPPPSAPEIIVQAPKEWPSLVPIAQRLLEITREIERLEREEEEAAFMLLIA